LISLSTYSKNYKKFNILNILIETNRTTFYMLTFVFTYKLKDIVKERYVNSTHYTL